MRSINHDQRYYNSCFISPGAVGTVGDALLGVRLAQSAPDMHTRWDKNFSGQNEIFLGSNVQDGQHRGYCSGGGPSRVYDSNWGSGRSFKTNIGWRVEDVTIPDKNVEPFLSSAGDYTWRNKVATVYEALRTGENFLPLPGPFRPADGVVPRAPSVRVTDIIGGDPIFEKTYSEPLPYGSRMMRK